MTRDLRIMSGSSFWLWVWVWGWLWLATGLAGGGVQGRSTTFRVLSGSYKTRSCVDHPNQKKLSETFRIQAFMCLVFEPLPLVWRPVRFQLFGHSNTRLRILAFEWSMYNQVEQNFTKGSFRKFGPDSESNGGLTQSNSGLTPIQQLVWYLCFDLDTRPIWVGES